MHRCTGACCHPIYLSISDEDLRDRADQGDPEAKLIANLFRLVGDSMHKCAALTKTGCRLSREARPRMCTDYPYDGTRPCNKCGARSDAEARGVALALRVTEYI